MTEIIEKIDYLLMHLKAETTYSVYDMVIKLEQCIIAYIDKREAALVDLTSDAWWIEQTAKNIVLHNVEIKLPWHHCAEIVRRRLEKP